MWIISIDILQDEADYGKYSERMGLLNESLYQYNRLSQCIRSTSIATPEYSIESDYLEKCSYHFSAFVKRNFIENFGKLNKKAIQNFKKLPKFGFYPYVKKIQNELMVNTNKSKNQKNTKSIFGFSHYYESTDAPLVLYLAPKKDLFSSIKQVEFEKMVRLFIKRKMQGTFCTVIDGYALTSLDVALYPWDGIIFIDSRYYQNKNDHGIHLPVFLQYLVKQIVSYCWLKYRYKLLQQNNIVNFGMASLTEKISGKDAIASHQEIIKYSGIFYELEMNIRMELPLILNQLSSFNGFIESSSISEEEYEHDYYKHEGIFIKQFVRAIENKYSDLCNYLNKYATKNETIISYSRDKLNSIGIIESLKLQKQMNRLTVFIAILTLLLAIDNRFISWLIDWLQDILPLIHKAIIFT